MPVETERLDEALATGPFSLALRLAVRSSGLTLDRLQVRLREYGVPVSKTALSYWQHGRTQPERPESLRALAIIESLAGVEPGALSALLGPPRPRGRWLSHKPGVLRPDQAWARPDGLARALQRMGTTPEAMHHLTSIGLHLQLTVGADRRIDSITYHQVARAEREQVDRKVVAFRTDLAGAEPLRITGTRGCRPGRQRNDEPTGFTTFELLLDRPLQLGELTVLQYTLEPSPGLADTVHTQRVQRSLRDFSIQLAFPAGVLPARVYHTYRTTVSDDRTTSELTLGASHTAQFAELDPTSGIYSIAWDWT